MKGLEEMKQTMKRLAASALAAVMTLGLSATAFAAGNGGEKTLTVTGDTLDNKKVYAVQMFEARVTEGETNTFDNYELVDAWLSFFTTEDGSGGIGLTDQDGDEDVDADDARAYLEELKNESTEVKTFADKAQKWVRDHSSYFTVITSDDESEPVADKETFTNLKPGYYLVYPEGGSTGDDNRGTDAMLVNVPTDKNAEWNIKSTYPTVDKKVDTDNEGNGEAADNGSAQIGDTVTFTLTSTVPDMSDYNTYKFNFVDTMSNGLTFVKAGDSVATTDVTVTIGGAPVTTGFTVTLEGQKLTVAFADLKTVSGADAGDAIVVTYRAMINQNAVSTDPVTNEAKVEYSNDPNGEGMGESTPDETDVYTYDIKVHKYTGTWNSGSVGYLAGATFVLSKSTDLGEDNANAIKLVNTDGGTGNAYRVAKPDEDSAVTSFTTTATGPITISGLEAGTYYLHEIEAPAGYNKLTAPIEIKIEATDGDYSKPTYTINGVANADQDSTIPVENKQGITLPETGSIGTIGLTVAGVAIVLLGVFATRKKKTTQE